MSIVESELSASAGLPFTFHRRRKKLSEMFKSSYCNWTGVAASELEVARQRSGHRLGERETTLHGFYVKLDHRGRAVHSENLTVHFFRWGEGELSYTVQPHDDQKGAGLQYLWTEHGKWVKLKAVAARASKESPEKILQPTKASGHKRKGDSCVVRWSRKGRNGYLRCPNVDLGPEGDSNEMSGGGEADEEDTEDGDVDEIVSGYDHIKMNYNIHNGRSYYHNESICYKRPGCYKRKDSYFNKGKRKRNAGERYEDSPTRGHRAIKSINCCAKNYLLGRSVTSRNSKRWKQGVEAMKHESTSSSFEGCYEYGEWETYLENGDDCGGRARPDNLTLGQFCLTDVTKRPRRGVRIRSEHVPLNDENFSASTNDIHSANDLSLTKLHHDAVHTSSKVGEDYDKRTTDEPIGEDSVDTQTSQTIKADKRPTIPTSTQDTRGKEYVTVLLSRATTRPDCLVTEFRQDYREGACKPRRFAINISRLMYQHVILRTRLRIRAVPKLDMSTYLVFAFSGEFPSGQDEYRVWVNSVWSNSPAGQMLRSFATDHKVARIHELIEDVVRAVDEVDIKQLRARTGSLPAEVRQRPVCLFNMLVTVARWETDSFCLPHTSEWCDRESEARARKADSPEKILGDVMALLDEKINDFSQCTSRGPANAYLCGICLLDFSSKDREGQPLPLALTSCSHWFCEDCWRSKVVIQLKRGRRPCHVDCPEKDCRGRMDPVTTLSLMRVHDIRRMNQFKVDNYVVTSPLVKICPNASCGRILFAKPQAQADKSTLIVTCACSCQLCFKCARAPHWPSSCEMSDRYHNLISESGEDILTRTLLDGEFPEVVSRGKNCPRCRMFIQETNNLRFVTCACGCQFCWPCGKEINGSVVPHTRCVEVFEQSDKVLKEIILNGKMELEDAQSSRWYRTALTHRKMRHPEVVIAMYAMADTTAKSIASSAQNGRYVGGVESAVKGWGKNLTKWARENYDNLHSPNTISAPVLGHQGEDNYRRSPRPLTSASSNRSASSFSNDPPDSDFSIAAATYNIVQSKLELHHIVEYTSVLLSNSLHIPSRLVQSLERAEDICTTLGILLQSSSAQNPRQIIPAFLRVQRQAINTIGDIVSFLEKVPSGVFGLDEN
ncbi:unnamed protein product [Lymnaea stagnalis]|uniref:RBR-type E3 ubiquitin transferase n=1 Tax=Lymnaea stagnalis TaxID=6523 RepID=A0AAV2I0W2_LYMST